jgi:hypothetical protein
MKSVDIKALVQGSSATLEVNMVFTNPLSGPLELTYCMSFEEDTIFSGLVAKVDEKETEAVIMKKERAQEKYEDAIAGGHVGLLAEKTTRVDADYTVKLGNLKPGSTCSMTLKLIKSLDVFGSSYHLSIPHAFFPDYKKHGLKGE